MTQRPSKPGWGMRLAHGALLLSARFTRSMLLGVRAIVLDGEDRVLLVRHTYVAGWHLPGGGVEIGETMLQALERELAEEGNIVLDGPPRLHGIFFNPVLGNRDHVAVYVVREFRQTAPRKPDREIAECAFFPNDRLPAGTIRPVEARLREVLVGEPVATHWGADR